MAITITVTITVTVTMAHTLTGGAMVIVPLCYHPPRSRLYHMKRAVPSPRHHPLPPWPHHLERRDSINTVSILNTILNTVSTVSTVGTVGTVSTVVRCVGAADDIDHIREGGGALSPEQRLRVVPAKRRKKEEGRRKKEEGRRSKE